jgi:uncharacterized protein YybS (DUF2232 family)
MNFPDKGMLLDTCKGSVATVALFLAYITLPLAGVLPGIFAPLPGMYYTLKNGKSVGIAIVLISAGSLAILANPMTLFLYLVQSGLMSLVMPYILAKGWGGARAIAFSVSAGLACILLVVLFAWLVRGIDLHGEILKGINSSISQTVKLYEKSGLKEEDLQSLRQGMEQAGAMIGRVYPALILVGLGAVAGFNLLMLRKMAEKFDFQLSIGELKNFRNPDNLIWFVIVPGFALLLKNADVSMAALNLLVLVLSLYFMQGLAVTVHTFERLSVSRLVRTTFYVLLALQPYLAVALALFGIFDLWGNFRTPKQK